MKIFLLLLLLILSISFKSNESQKVIINLISYKIINDITKQKFGYIYQMSRKKWQKLIHALNGNMENTDIFSLFNIVLDKERIKELTEVYKLKFSKIPKETLLTIDSVKNYLKMRHDTIHMFLCEYINIKYGERPIYLDLGHSGTVYDELTPDIVIVNNFDVLISDVSITSSVDAVNNEKIAKYSKFIEAFPNYKFYYYNFIISDSGNFSFNSDILSQGCRNLISSHYNKNKKSYNSVKFNELRSICETGNIIFDVDYNIPNDLLEFAKDSFNININDLLKSEDLTNYKVTKRDEEYLKHISNIPCIETREVCSYEKLMSAFDTYKFGNKKSALISPIPINTKIRKTDRSYNKLLKILNYTSGPISKALRSFIHDSEAKAQVADVFNAKIKSTSVFTCSLLKEDIIEIAKEGPNKKRIMKEINVKKDSDIKDEILIYKNNVKDIEHLLSRLSTIEPFTDDFNTQEFLSQFYVYSDFKDCVSGYLGDESKHVSDYIRGICATRMSKAIFYIDQVYKHIAFMANHNRKDFEFKFSILPNHNTVIILHPGSRLKGEKIVWFKLITTEVYEEDISYIHQQPIKTFYNGYESRWLSADVSRTDYYSRIFDKFLILNACQIDCLGVNLSKFPFDNLNVSNLMLIENKSSTSRMVGVLRYYFMKFFSLESHFLDKLVTEKLFAVPFRSELCVYFYHLTKNYSEFYFKNRHNYIKPTDISIKDGKIFTSSFQLKKVPSILNESLISWRQFICEWYLYYCFNKNSGMIYHKVRQSMEKTLLYENEAREILLNKEYSRFNGIIDDNLLIQDKQLKFSYSGRAVNIAMKLLLKECPKYIGCLVPQTILNDISSLASMSSSVMMFEPQIDISKVLNQPSIKLQKKQLFEQSPNNRSKVVVELIKFLKENPGFRTHDKSWVHIMKNPHIPNVGEFPKNQYLSTREIYIMDIKTRICQSAVESIFRKIATYSNKEFLSKPEFKVSTQQNHSEFSIRSLSESSSNVVIEETIDNTKWSQNFVCMIFVWFSLPLYSIMPGYTKLIIATFLNMCRKYVEIPKILLLNWIENPDRDVEDVLKPYKESFLKEGNISFNNISHMGQGIFHFVSSLLHCAQCMLRDRILKYKKTDITILDMITSDDRKSTIIMTSAQFKENVYYKYKDIDFLTRRLMAINQSAEKSSTSNVISEFNSCFVIGNSNCTPTIKWALSSTENKISESISSLMQSHYNSTRDIKTNGGSSQLCLLSHFINKNYIETLLGTYANGPNDPSLILGVSRNEVPYEFGIYPLLQMDTAEFLGPNYASWLAIEKSKKYNTNIHKLYNKLFSNAADYKSDDMYVGKLDIKFKIGQFRKLKYFKKLTEVNRKMIDQTLEENPYLVISEPKTHLQSIIKCALMLFSSKAHLSFIQKNQVMQYQRISAGKHSYIYKVKGLIKSPTTFKLALEILKEYDYSHSSIIFPDSHLYELSKEYVDFIPKNYYKSSGNIQKQQNLSKVGYTFINQHYLIYDIVKYFEKGFLSESLAKSIMPLRDYIYIGIDLDDSAAHYHCKKHQYLNLLMNVIRMQTASKFKICFTGDSTKTIRDSLINLRKYPGSSRQYVLDVKSYSIGHRLSDIINKSESYACIFGKTISDGFYYLLSVEQDINESIIIDNVLRETLDVSCLNSHQKQLLLIMLCEFNRFDLISNYMLNNRIYLHNWDIPLAEDNSTGKITIQNHENIMSVELTNFTTISLIFNSTPNKSYYTLLESCLRMLNLNPLTAITSYNFIGDKKFAIEVPKLDIPGYFIMSGNSHKYKIDQNLKDCYLTAENFEVLNIRDRLVLYADKKIISIKKLVCHSHHSQANNIINIHGFLCNENEIYYNGDFNTKFYDINVEYCPENENLINKFKSNLTSKSSLFKPKPIEVEQLTLNLEDEEKTEPELVETPSFDDIFGALVEDFDMSAILEVVKDRDLDSQEILEKERLRRKEFMSSYQHTQCRLYNTSVERSVCSIKWNLDRTFINRYVRLMNMYGLKSHEHICMLYIECLENLENLSELNINIRILKSFFLISQTLIKTYSGHSETGMEIYNNLIREFIAPS